jgi:negative regulator of flagellin synthesis FlgM
MPPIDRLRTAATASVAGVGNGLGTKAGKDEGKTSPRLPASVTPQQSVSIELKGAVDASRPPVDAERVAQIREALKDGNYPILPAKIADAMIAAQMMLGLGE